MSTHRGMFVIVSLFLLLRSVLSYYQDNSAENDADEYEELKGDGIIDNTLWKTNDDTYTSYPENIKDVLLKNDPELLYVTSMNRKRNSTVSN